MTFENLFNRYPWSNIQGVFRMYKKYLVKSLTVGQWDIETPLGIVPWVFKGVSKALLYDI